jgi:DNA-binding transcriptional LysR family regulator
MPTMDTLLSMKVFRQVVESGSFVGAAERLSLSTAMTSKHLMHLEKHLGTRLLNRSSRSLSLTESGKLFFERCKDILEEVEEAELAVGSVSGVPRGTLRVTAPTWGATRGMVDMVASYRQRYPEVVVDLSFEDRFVDLIEEGYDLAIRATADPPAAGLIARPLRPMPFVIAASKEYLQRCGVPQSPEELAQHDCIMAAGRYGRGRSRRFHLDDVEAWMRDDKRGSGKVAKPLRASKGDSHAWSLVASNGVATLCCQRRA